MKRINDALAGKNGLIMWIAAAVFLFIKAVYYQFATGLNTLPVFSVQNLVMFLSSAAVLLGIVAYTVLLERKLMGHIQNRWGPSRVGPFGPRARR